jgi:hypothetical protein
MKNTRLKIPHAKYTLITLLMYKSLVVRVKDGPARPGNKRELLVRATARLRGGETMREVDQATVKWIMIHEVGAGIRRRALAIFFYFYKFPTFIHFPTFSSEDDCT